MVLIFLIVANIITHLTITIPVIFIITTISIITAIVCTTNRKFYFLTMIKPFSLMEPYLTFPFCLSLLKFSF